MSKFIENCKHSLVEKITCGRYPKLTYMMCKEVLQGSIWDLRQLQLFIDQLGLVLECYFATTEVDNNGIKYLCVIVKLTDAISPAALRKHIKGAGFKDWYSLRFTPVSSTKKVLTYVAVSDTPRVMSDNFLNN